MSRSIRSLSAFTIALSALAMLTSVRGFSRPSDADVQAVNFEKLPDPGDAPPLIPPDYRKYSVLNVGTETVTGRIRVVLKSGEVVPCNHRDGVDLYPDTPFTRWMIVKWAVLINEKVIVPSPVFLTSAKVPVWLDETATPAQQRVIRETSCTDDGRFTFMNVPPGKYFVESLVTRFGGPRSEGVGSVLTQSQTPYGPEGTYSDSTGGGGKTPSDNYVVVSKFPVEILPGKRAPFTYALDDLKVISHSFEK